MQFWHVHPGRIVIRGPDPCTCPIATGIVFTSLDKPDVAAYTSKYDDMTPEQFDALSDEQKRADGALAYFATGNGPNPLEIAVTLPTWRECRYVHIKLMSSRVVEDDFDVAEQNIDLERVALVGFPTPETDIAATAVRAIAKSGDHDSLTYFHYNATTSSADELYVDYISGKAADDVDKLKEDATKEHYCAATQLHEAEEDAAHANSRAILDIIDIPNATRYHYSSAFTDANVRAWLRDYEDDALQHHVKSQPRPANDAHPSRPGVLQVTADTFDELVVGGERNVLVVVEQWTEHNSDKYIMSAMVTQWLSTLAAGLPDRSELLLASYDYELNDEPDTLPCGEPAIVLYLASNKSDPVVLDVNMGRAASVFRWLKKQLPALPFSIVEQAGREDAVTCAKYCKCLQDYLVLNQAYELLLDSHGHLITPADTQRLNAANTDALTAATELADAGELTIDLAAQLEAALAALSAECGRWQPLRRAIARSEQAVEEAEDELDGADQSLTKEEEAALTKAIRELAAVLNMVNGTKDEGDNRQRNEEDDGEKEEEEDGEGDAEAGEEREEEEEEEDDEQDVAMADGANEAESDAEVQGQLEAEEAEIARVDEPITATQIRRVIEDA